MGELNGGTLAMLFGGFFVHPQFETRVDARMDLDHAWNSFDAFHESSVPGNPAVGMSPITAQWLTLRATRPNPMGLPGDTYGRPLDPSEHDCTIVKCVDFIETISSQQNIYGCMISGHVHRCFADDRCLYSYTARNGMIHCIFSKLLVGTSYDAWDRESAYCIPRASRDFNRDNISLDHTPTETPKNGRPGLAGKSGKNGVGPKKKGNVWKGRRTKRGSHRIVNTSDPGYRKPYRTRESLPEKAMAVLAADVQTGSAFLTLCAEMEREALDILRFLLGDSELRSEHATKQRKRRLGEAAVKIKTYAGTSEKTNLAPNMHVIDNIYDSVAGISGKRGECIRDQSVIDRFPMFATSALTMWLTYMIAIGGYPFRPSKRGQGAATRVFGPKGLKYIFDRVTNDVNPMSYSTCYRRFIIGVILSIARPGIALRYHDPPDSFPENCVRTDTLIAHEPAVLCSLPTTDILESLSSCAATMSLATSSTGVRNGSSGKKRRVSYSVGCLEKKLELIKNGTLLGKTSVKESETIFEKFIDMVALTELQPMLNKAIDVCKRNNLREVREPPPASFFPERSDAPPVQRTCKTLTIDDISIESPYVCLVTTYGTMVRL